MRSADRGFNGNDILGRVFGSCTVIPEPTGVALDRSARLETLTGTLVDKAAEYRLV